MKNWIKIAGAALVAIAVGYFVWQSQRAPSLPNGIFETNGRIEADQVQIATKFAGRIADILAKEGDMVEAGQTLARMDTEELQAQLNVAEAQARRTEKALLETEAMVAQRKGEQTYARQEFDRTEQVHREGYATAEKLDQRRSALNTADAAFRASEAGVEEAKAAIEAANADVRRYKSQLDEAVLQAPKRGRIQYRLAEPGEVRAAGGSILTLLDLTDVYMTVFSARIRCRFNGAGRRSADHSRSGPAVCDPGPGHVCRGTGTVHAQGCRNGGGTRKVDVQGEAVD